MDKQLIITYAIISLLTLLVNCSTSDVSESNLSKSNMSDTEIAESRKQLREAKVLAELQKLELDFNWRPYLITVPSLITVIGTLVIFGGYNNFKLTPLNLINGTNYNDSLNFQTRTGDIANEVMLAFEEAQSNIAGIGEGTKSMHGLVKAMIKVLAKGTLNKQLLLIPKFLFAIKGKAKLCADYGHKTEQTFLEVMNSLRRFAEALIATDSKNNAEQTSLIENLKSYLKAKKKNAEQIKENEKRLAELEKEEDKSRQKYFDAIKNMPDGDLLKKILNAFGKSFSFIDILFPPAALIKKLKSLSDGTDEDYKKKKEIFEQTQIVLHKAEALKETHREIGSALNSVLNSDTMEQEEKYAKQFQKIKEIILSELSSKNTEKSPMNQKFIDVCHKTADLLDGFLKTHKNKTINTKYLGSFLKGLKKLMTQTNGLFIESSKLYGVDLIHSESTMEDVSGEFTKVKELEEVYENNRQRYDSQLETVWKYRDDLDAIMEKISGANFSVANVEKLKQIIKEAVLMMMEFCNFWTDMVTMIQKVTVTIDIIINPSVVALKKYTNLKLNVTKEITDISSTNLMVHQIKTEAIYLSRYAAFIQYYAETYVSISIKNYMTPLNQMQPLAYLDNEVERQNAIKSFKIAGASSQKNIVEFIHKKDAEFIDELNKRKSAITKILNVTLEAGLMEKIESVDDY